MKDEHFEFDENQRKKLNAVFALAMIKSLYKQSKISLKEYKTMIKNLNGIVNIKLV